MKNMKKTIALLLVLILCVSLLASCGASLSGKYYAISMDNGENTYSEAEIKEQYDGDVYLEFLKDGKCNMVMGDSGTAEITFKVEGKNITLTNLDYPDEPISGTINGKKITLGNDDLTIVFEKK